MNQIEEFFPFQLCDSCHVYHFAGRTEESYFEYRKVGDQPAQSKYRIARQDFHSADPNLQEIVYEPPIVEEGTHLEALQDRARQPTIEQGDVQQENVGSMEKKKTYLGRRDYGKNLQPIQKPNEDSAQTGHEGSPNPFSETYRGRWRNPSGTVETGALEDLSSDTTTTVLQGQPQKSRDEVQPKGSREHGTLPSYSAATGPLWKSDTVHSKPSKGRGRRSVDPERGEVPLPTEDSPSLSAGIASGLGQRSERGKRSGIGERHAVNGGGMARTGLSTSEAPPPPLLRTGVQSGLPKGEKQPVQSGEQRDLGDLRAQEVEAPRRPAPPPIRREVPGPSGISALHHADSPMHSAGLAFEFQSGSYDDAQFREPAYLADAVGTSDVMPDTATPEPFPTVPSYLESPGLATGTSSQAPGEESGLVPGFELRGLEVKTWDTWIPSPQASDYRHIKVLGHNKDEQAPGNLNMEKPVKKSSKLRKKVGDMGEVLSQDRTPSRSSPLARPQT